MTKLTANLFRQCFRNGLKLATVFLTVCLGTAYVQAASVTMRWNPSGGPDVAGYRVYSRSDAQAYDFQYPDWQGSATQCTLDQLQDETTYHFVVRAYDAHGHESINSNEVTYVPEPVSDPEFCDSQYDRPRRPRLAGPASYRNNLALNPTLTTHAFEGDGFSRHTETLWRIIDDDDPDQRDVYNVRTTRALTRLVVPACVLAENRTYRWQVMFTDQCGSDSQWSEPRFFTTGTDYSDADGNGIVDSAEVDRDVDLDGNGIPDEDQDNIKCITAANGVDLIGVGYDVAEVAGIETLSTCRVDEIAADSGASPGSMPMGLINFRLALADGHWGARVSVNVYFSSPVPTGVQWYKYDLADGWQNYSDNVDFAPDRRSMTITLEDGGIGDADQVVNGIIIDPSGFTSSFSVPASSGGAGATGSGGGGGGGCFIQTARVEGNTVAQETDNLLSIGLLLVGSLFLSLSLLLRRREKK